MRQTTILLLLASLCVCTFSTGCASGVHTTNIPENRYLIRINGGFAELIFREPQPFILRDYHSYPLGFLLRSVQVDTRYKVLTLCLEKNGEEILVTTGDIGWHITQEGIVEVGADTYSIRLFTLYTKNDREMLVSFLEPFN